MLPQSTVGCICLGDRGLMMGNVSTSPWALSPLSWASPFARGDVISGDRKLSVASPERGSAVSEDDGDVGDVEGVP